MTRTRAPRTAPIEAGAVETEQVTVIHTDEPIPFPEAARDEGAPTEAAITGAEMSAIRIRVELVDKAQEHAKKLQEEATFAAQLFQVAQSELSMTIATLTRQYRLDPSHQYRLDPDSGRLVKVEPRR